MVNCPDNGTRTGEYALYSGSILSGRNSWETMAEQFDIPLPEIAVEEFQRLWTRFEVLAVVGASKEFYPYLYGFSFRLVTDHNPLTSLRNIKDVGGRLTRWILYLQQFNFTWEHRAGSNHAHILSIKILLPVPIQC